MAVNCIAALEIRSKLRHVGPLRLMNAPDLICCLIAEIRNVVKYKTEHKETRLTAMTVHVSSCDLMADL